MNPPNLGTICQILDFFDQLKVWPSIIDQLMRTFYSNMLYIFLTFFYMLINDLVHEVLHHPSFLTLLTWLTSNLNYSCHTMQAF
jgi:hypothetical protein